MSFPSAYSLELKRQLSAKEAYDFSCLPTSHPNKLHNAKSFQCSENCSFKLTLTNFNNPDFTRPPYFTHGERNQVHDPFNCQLIIENYERREKETKTENHGFFSREKNNLIINLDLVKGNLAIVAKPRQKNEKGAVPGPTVAVPKHVRTTSSSTIDEKTFRSHIKQLRDLILYYLEYLSGEKYRFYNKQEQEIQLENYFVNLADAKKRGINLEDVHIYYDTATVKYHYNAADPNNSYFLIRFNHKCTIGKTSVQPTIIVNETKAIHHGVGYKMKTLKAAAKDGKPLKLFFFGSFIKHPTRDFINSNVNPKDILDYIVIS